jgi:CP12 domain
MLQDLENKIEQARADARAVCEAKGKNSTECAAAWDAVEEMQAEASHQRQVKPKTNFEVYCNENPDAVECRVYDD